MEAPTKDPELADLDVAIATGRFHLDNCERAVAGLPPRTRAAYEKARLGLDDNASTSSPFSDLFGTFFTP